MTILGLEKMTLFRATKSRSETTGRSETFYASSDFYASVQQPDHQMMKRLEPGYSSEDVRVLVSYAKVFAENEAQDIVADEFEFDGGYGVERWKVLEVRDATGWRNQHYHSTVIRESAIS